MALPGKLTDMENEELAHLGSVIETALQRTGPGDDGDVQTDSSWRRAKGIALKSVSSRGELSAMVEKVMKGKDTVLKKCICNQLTVLSRYAWPQATLELWSKSGFISRMSRDAIDAYVGLLQHLLSVAESSGWKVAQEEIDYHVEKLSYIRSMANNREECVIGGYCYLRDCLRADWTSPKLDRERILSFQKKLEALEGPTKETEKWVCKKCGTSLIHPEGTRCIFAEKTNTDARKAAQALPLALSQGVTQA